MAEKELTVELDFGRHTINEPKSMRKAITDIFSRAKLKGKFVVSVGARIRGSNHSREFFVKRLDIPGKKISFTVQSDGKDSKHFCNLSIPPDFRENPEQFLNLLYFASGDERYNEFSKNQSKENPP